MTRRNHHRNGQGGQNAKYPWAALFVRSRFVLKRGRDFRCSSMAQQVRNEASARGLGVSITETASGLVVRVKRRARKSA